MANTASAAGARRTTAAPTSARAKRPGTVTHERVSGVPLPFLLLIFVGAGAAIWIAGIFLSNQTDVLSTRLHLGSALGRLILLAVATNPPEIAIVASASLSGNVGVAVGNILGGIALKPSSWSCWTSPACAVTGR